MYCPQCGTESPHNQRFCRSCGANLKVIGRAVALSEAIARSDRGPLPKIKEMMQSVKIEQTTEEISNALELMNQEITRHVSSVHQIRPWRLHKKEEPPEQRRENHLAHGIISVFTGIALMIFLYYFSAALVLKISPEKLAKLPFELEPILRIAWLVGLIPMLSGMGRIVAGLLISPAVDIRGIADGGPSETSIAPRPTVEEAPASVAERTTEMLEHKASTRRTP